MNRSNVWNGLVVNDWWIRFLTFEDMGLEEDEHFAYCVCLLCECNTSIKVNCLEVTKCLNCEKKKTKKTVIRCRHGYSYTKLFRVWGGIKCRCYCVSYHHFYNYGGRGISVCDEWRNSFIVFRDWALSNGYEEGLTIERIDNNGNYCPENCKWITRGEQQSNTRRNRFLTCNGETKTIAQWSRTFGISESYLRHKTNEGYTLEEIIIKISNDFA